MLHYGHVAVQYSANAEKNSICCTVDKILLRNNPPCGFGLSPRSRDQPQPGSLFSRSWGRGERDPGNEVGPTLGKFDVIDKTYSVFITLINNFVFNEQDTCENISCFNLKLIIIFFLLFFLQSVSV